MKTPAAPHPAVSSLSARLATWTCTLDAAQAPDDVQQALRNCLLYNLSMALAVDADHDPLGDILHRVADTPGPARLIGGRGSRRAEDAAFINAGLITARGQNDTHPAVVAHIGCVVIPAVLALADECRASSATVLDALLTGYEAIPRLAGNLSDASQRRGFRATPVFGVLGATLACARVLGLTGAETAHALSFATQHASGTLQTWSDHSQEWRLQVATASRDSITCARLAQAGLVGAAHCLEGDSGFAQAYAGTPAELDLDGWRIRDIAFKLYPGCAFNQAPVHALRQLMAREAIRPATLVRLDVHLHPLDAAYPGITTRGPFSSQAGAVMSAPFMLAATLRDGQPRMTHFRAGSDDTALHGLSERIHVHGHDDVARWQCRIVATLADGSVHHHAFDDPGAFILDGPHTVQLTHALSEEWPHADRAARHDQLAQAIQGMDQEADWHTVQALIYQPSPRTCPP